MPNPSRQARSLRLSTYPCEHPNRNLLLFLPLSCLSVSVKHSWFHVQMTSPSLNQNPIHHNPVLSTQISTPTLTAIALINSSYEYRWNEGFRLALFFSLSFHSQNCVIDITLTLTASIGHPKYKITINDSPKC